MFATAKTTSLCLALIVGAVATIAVAPHILVPTAIKVATVGFKLKILALRLTNIRVRNMQGITTIRLFEL